MTSTPVSSASSVSRTSAWQYQDRDGARQTQTQIEMQPQPAKDEPACVEQRGIRRVLPCLADILCCARDQRRSAAGVFFEGAGGTGARGCGGQAARLTSERKMGDLGKCTMRKCKGKGRRKRGGGFFFIAKEIHKSKNGGLVRRG